MRPAILVGIVWGAIGCAAVYPSGYPGQLLEPSTEEGGGLPVRVIKITRTVAVPVPQPYPVPVPVVPRTLGHRLVPVAVVRPLPAVVALPPALRPRVDPQRPLYFGSPTGARQWTPYRQPEPTQDSQQAANTEFAMKSYSG